MLIFVDLFLVFGAFKMSGSFVSNKRACSGQSIKMFDSITLNESDASVSLYVNGDRNIVIATWTIKGSDILPEYHEKVNLDDKGTLSIRNLDLSDQGMYSLIYHMGNITRKSDAILDVLIAPATDCRPTIKQVEDILVANLLNDICGKPTVSVKWVEYSGTILENTNTVKLQQGREAGTYSACINGPALMCDRNANASDHCSVYKIDKSKNSENSDNAGGNTHEWQTLIIAVSSILSILVFSALVMCVIFRDILKGPTSKSQSKTTDWCKRRIRVTARSMHDDAEFTSLS